MLEKIYNILVQNNKILYSIDKQQGYCNNDNNNYKTGYRQYPIYRKNINLSEVDKILINDVLTYQIKPPKDLYKSVL